MMTEKTDGTPSLESDLVRWREFDPSWLPGGESHSLARAYITYRDRLDELLRHEGEYVAIHDETVLGYFPRRRQAIDEAIKTFGPVPVLVKRIVEVERPRYLGGVVF